MQPCINETIQNTLMLVEQSTPIEQDQAVDSHRKRRSSSTAASSNRKRLQTPSTASSPNRKQSNRQSTFSNLFQKYRDLYLARNNFSDTFAAARYQNLVKLMFWDRARAFRTRFGDRAIYSDFNHNRLHLACHMAQVQAERTMIGSRDVRNWLSNRFCQWH